jgi:hypothetical protein
MKEEGAYRHVGKPHRWYRDGVNPATGSIYWAIWQTALQEAAKIGGFVRHEEDDYGNYYAVVYDSKGDFVTLFWDD